MIIKQILLWSFFFPAIVSAESCWTLFEERQAYIQKEDGYKTYVGGHLYHYRGNWGYHPGLKVEADIDNWAEDLLHAIKWGPYLYSMRSQDPRKEWLETFRKAASSQCKLTKGDYKELRSMLKDLMDDGSFCPANKITEPGFLGSKAQFKKVLIEAIETGRFNQYCNNPAVQDDTYRNIKDSDEPIKKPAIAAPKASKQ